MNSESSPALLEQPVPEQQAEDGSLCVCGQEVESVTSYIISFVTAN